MSNPGTDEIPELKQILGALLFGAKGPLPLKDLRKTVEAVAEELGGAYAPFAELRDRDVREAMEQLTETVEKARIGFTIVERTEGFLLQSDAACGPWLRHLLDMGKSSRLSRPALETLAIVAYKQPVTRAEIESVRGVSVDHILKALIELQLVRIVGRSELPGKPLLFGTTKAFLDHFGLRGLKDLPGLDELARLEAQRRRPETVEAGAEADEAGAEAAPDGEPSQAEPGGAEPVGEGEAAADGPDAEAITAGEAPEAAYSAGSEPEQAAAPDASDAEGKP